MKKRIYRAQEVKGVDLEQIVEPIEDRLVVGIDVAKETMYAVLMNASQEVLVTLKWSHPKESREVVNRLAKLPIRSIEVAMEPSGTYGDSLRWLFYKASLPVFRVKPKKVKDSREIYDGVPSSHDAKASAIVAWLHLLGRSEPWTPRRQERRALAAAMQPVMMHDLAFRQAQNRLEAELARVWPEQELDLDSVTLLELLSQYGSPAGVARKPEEARDLMMRVGGPGLDLDKIDRVIDSAASTVGVPMIEAEEEMLRHLAQEARHQQKAKKQLKKRVESLTEESSVHSVGEVVGRVTAAVLEVKLGSAENYPSHKSYLKAAGLNLKVRSSGKRQGQLAITKRGPSLVRQYLYLAALRWIKTEPRARAWYLRKVRRDGGKIKRKALVALMRKLMTGLWWVGRGRPFDVDKLFQRLEAEA